MVSTLKNICSGFQINYYVNYIAAPSGNQALMPS